MKKITLLCLSVFILVIVNGQTKITKAGIVGKWMISSAEMPTIFYYNVDKDSLALGDAIKAQVQGDQMAGVLAMMKPQLEPFKKVSFLFNADGSAELNDATQPTPRPATYTIDEENSTITTTEPEGGKQETLKGEMQKDNLLRLTLKSPQGDIFLVLKKVK